MKKTHKVVMLPTKKASPLCINKGKLLYLPMQQEPHNVKNFKNQHLYALSDEKIREGDWYVFENKLFRYKMEKVLDHRYCKKVITTNDKSLTKEFVKLKIIVGPKAIQKMKEFPNTNRIPQLPESFIKAYVEQGGIDYVDLEYDCDHPQMPSKVIDKLKLRDDNSVIVHQVKEESYSREDMFKLKELANAIISPAIDILPDTYDDEIEAYLNWIKDNLKSS